MYVTCIYIKYIKICSCNYSPTSSCVLCDPVPSTDANDVQFPTTGNVWQLISFGQWNPNSFITWLQLKRIRSQRSLQGSGIFWIPSCVYSVCVWFEHGGMYLWQRRFCRKLLQPYFTRGCHSCTAIDAIWWSVWLNALYTPVVLYGSTSRHIGVVIGSQTVFSMGKVGCPVWNRQHMVNS